MILTGLTTLSGQRQYIDLQAAGVKIYTEQFEILTVSLVEVRPDSVFNKTVFWDSMIPM